MASTNKTANLSLNQWVPTDPVLMEDMNEDNRKLDAALGVACAVKLFSVDVKTAAQTVELDFSGIDMSKFVSLHAYCYTRLDNPSIRMRINNLTDNDAIFYFSTNTGSWMETSGYLDISLGGVEISLCTKSFYLDSGNFQLRRTNTNKITAISKLSFYGNGFNMPVGAKIVVTGVRA